MAKPAPKQITVCTLCNLSWRDHLEVAVEWARDAQMLDYDEEGTEPTPDEVNAQLTTEACVVLLKEANRGPMGPPGVMGPMGASAH